LKRIKSDNRSYYPTVGHNVVNPTITPPPVIKNPSVASKLKRINPITLIRGLLRFENGKCVNILEIASSVEILKIAYETIKSKPGNMSRGTNKETLDGISDNWFEETSSLLKKELFVFRPSRRIYIPKPNGKHRPLGISSPRDKIVQQAMRLVLEILLEPHFLDCSHGFRAKRGCHSALKEIRSWQGMS